MLLLVERNNMYKRFLPFVIVFGLQIYAWSTPPEPIHFSYSLSKTAILSGEFLSVKLTAVNAGDEMRTIEIVGNHVFHQNTFNISVSGANGIKIDSNRRKPVIFSRTLSNMLCCNIRANESITISYPIHLQWDTHFPPGEYMVRIAPLSATVSGHQHMIPGAEMKLQVVGIDEACLVGKYDESLRSPMSAPLADRKNTYDNVDLMEIPACALELLCAYGKEAVGSQLQFVYTKKAGFVYYPEITIHAWDNIAEHATADVIDHLLTIVNSPEFTYGGFPGKRYDPGIIWCLHRVYERGNKDVKGRLREVCTKMPEEFNYEAIQYANR